MILNLLGKTLGWQESIKSIGAGISHAIGNIGQFICSILYLVYIGVSFLVGIVEIIFKEVDLFSGKFGVLWANPILV